MTQGPAPSNCMRAAIIGSGPAGLTIAVILARYGYDVTILKEKIKLAVSFVTVSRNSVCQNLSWMILNTAT